MAAMKVSGLCILHAVNDVATTQKNRDSALFLQKKLSRRPISVYFTIEPLAETVFLDG